MRRRREEKKGLVKLRKQTAKTPAYPCENCHCNRYSPCGCKKKGNK